MLLRFIILIIISISSARADQWEEICSNVQRVAAFTGQIRNIPWPGYLTTPTGVIPTVVMATIQEESSFLSFCKIVKAAQSAEGIENIYVLKQVYNELQIDKYDKEMDALVLAADTASYVQARDSRRGKEFGVQDARALNRFLGDANEIYNRDLKQEDKIWTFTSRRERERNMVQISRSASKMSQINEQLSCDNVEDRGDVDPKVPARIRELESSLSELQRGQQEIYRILVNLGIKFLDMDDHKQYTQDLINMINLTYYLYGEESSREIKVIETDTRNNREFTTEKTQRVPFFEYQIEVTESYYNTFPERWAKEWETYMRSLSSRTLKGQFGDKRAELERQFHDLDYECSDSKLGANLDPENPEYFYILKRDKENCLKSISTRIKSSGGLVMYHVEELKKILKEISDVNAELWTIQSREFGMHRFQTKDKTKFNDFDVVKTECVSGNSLPEITQARTALKIENVRMRSLIAEELTKSTSYMEAEAARNKRMRDEENIRREIHRSNVENRTKIELKGDIIDL